MKACPITFRADNLRLAVWLKPLGMSSFVSLIEPGQDEVGAAATVALPRALNPKLTRAVAAFNAIMDEGETR